MTCSLVFVLRMMKSRETKEALGLDIAEWILDRLGIMVLRLALWGMGVWCSLRGL